MQKKARVFAAKPNGVRHTKLSASFSLSRSRIPEHATRERRKVHEAVRRLELARRGAIRNGSQDNRRAPDIGTWRLHSHLGASEAQSNPWQTVAGMRAQQQVRQLTGYMARAAISSWPLRQITLGFVRTGRSSLLVLQLLKSASTFKSSSHDDFDRSGSRCRQSER